MDTLPAGARRFSLADIAPEPWRNGGGITRPIAAGRLPGDEGNTDWTWRVSAAEIDRPGPFSVMPGTQRWSALLGRSPLTLRSAREQLYFARGGDRHAYPGDVAWDATLPGGQTRLFNLMTRRGAATGRLAAVQGATRLRAAAITVLLVSEGSFELALLGPSARPIEFHLGAGEGLLLEGVDAVVSIEAREADACLLHADVRQP